MKRTFFFSSAAGAVTASRGLYGKAMDSFSFTKAGAWRFQLASYKEEALEITPEQYQALMKGLEIISDIRSRNVYPQDLL